MPLSIHIDNLTEKTEFIKTDDDKLFFWNGTQKILLGPLTQPEFMDFCRNNAEVIDFDGSVARLRGANYAQVFKNHRNLRMKGLLKDGVYSHKGSGGPVAA